MKLESYEWVDGGGDSEIAHLWNTLVLLGCCPGRGFPIAYIHKPKTVTDSEWQEVKACFKNHLPGLYNISFEAGDSGK